MDGADNCPQVVCGLVQHVIRNRFSNVSDLHPSCVTGMLLQKWKVANDTGADKTMSFEQILPILATTSIDVPTIDAQYINLLSNHNV